MHLKNLLFSEYSKFVKGTLKTYLPTFQVEHFCNSILPIPFFLQKSRLGFGWEIRERKVLKILTASTYKVNQLSGSQTQLWLVDNSTDEKFVGPTQVTCAKLFKKETIFAKLLLLEHLLGNYAFQRSFLSQKYFPKRMFLYDVRRLMEKKKGSKMSNFL